MALSPISMSAYDTFLTSKSSPVSFSSYFKGLNGQSSNLNSTHKQQMSFSPASLNKCLYLANCSLTSRGASKCYSLEENKSSFSKGEKFELDDVIEAQQFDRNILDKIFQLAREMESIEKNSAGSQILKGFLMATLFYEPSTRTRLSFESAMKRLGGEVLTAENAKEFSSAAKGESLEGTIRTVEGYSDIIVMRHFESGAAKRAASTSNIPVINAGDGPGQHPTQWILYDWNNEECVKILKRCKEAILCNKKGGKVIIIDQVVGLNTLNEKSRAAELYFDMTMMVLVDGAERDEEEWSKIFTQAEFEHYRILPAFGNRCIIELFPYRSYDMSMGQI